MAMGAAPVEPGGLPVKGRYSRPSKPSPRTDEKGVTSQEAVEFAISYAKEQRQKQGRELESLRPGTAKEQQLLGPERDKHYHCVTKTQPGQLAADSPYSDLEIVAESWSKQSFTGIRALPEAGHYMPSTTTMRPSSWHIHSDNFGVWPYISSEYSRANEELAKQKRTAHALQLSDKDFIVPKAVLPVKGLSCFSQYDYDLSPYPLVKKSKQSSEARDKQKRIPFYPPGYLHYPTDLLRSRFSRGECLAQLEQELAATWPRAFLQVFENGASFVVVSFDAAAAEEEGDLTGYMNELARLNSVPGSWQLCKSTANWGQLQSGIIHFTLKPTWVSNKVPVAANLSGVLPAVQQASSHL